MSTFHWGMFVGSARTGASWVAKLIDTSIATRFIWEPCNHAGVDPKNIFEGTGRKQIQNKLYHHSQEVARSSQLPPAFPKGVADIEMVYFKMISIGEEPFTSIPTVLGVRRAREFFNNCKVVFVVRHPIRWLASGRMKIDWIKGTDDYDHYVSLAQCYIDRTNAILKEFRSDPDFICVRHEDVIDRPYFYTDAFCRFFDVFPGDKHILQNFLQRKSVMANTHFSVVPRDALFGWKTNFRFPKIIDMVNRSVVNDFGHLYHPLELY